MRERDIEAHLVKRVKELGGEIRKVKWIGRNGAPDRRVLAPTTPTGRGTFRYTPRAFWVEVKAPGGIATFPKDARERAQQREHERMREFGEIIYLVDSIELVDALLGAA